LCGIRALARRAMYASAAAGVYARDPEPRVNGIRPAPPRSWSPPPTAVTSLPSLRGPARSTTPGADWKGCQVTWAEAWPAVRTAAANPIAAAVAHRRAIGSGYRPQGDRFEDLTPPTEGDPRGKEAPPAHAPRRPQGA